MEREIISDDYLFSFLVTFVIAFFLSFISLGFFFFLFIFLLIELYYAYSRKYILTPDYMLLRFSIFLFGVFGFILGRILLVGDDKPFRHSFHEWK